MRIDFAADAAYPYAAARFSEMSGMSANDKACADAYSRISGGVKIRAAVRFFEDAVREGAIVLGGASIACPPIKAARGTVCAYALTAGEFTAAGGGTLSDTLADMWGTAFVDAGLRLLREKIFADNPGKHVSQPFGPGFYGIGIDAVAVIFNALDCGAADIELKDGLLSPLKSSIGFFLVSGGEIPLPPRDCLNCAGDTACEYCRSKTVKITFKNENKTASVPAGTTVADAARSVGITIGTPCGGMGICGKCAGIIETNGDTKITRLCSERVYEDASVYTKIIGDTKNDTVGVSVTDSGISGRCALAVDLGTTTVEAALIGDTKIIARAKMLNPQSLYAADVIGRIKLASEGGAMTALIKDGVNRVISEITSAANIRADDIKACIIAGNTAMQTILAGIDPSGLGRYPYNVPDAFGREYDAQSLGISLRCGVYFPPVISAFVGGDIICGIARTQLYERDKTLLLDIGTNGEIAYMNNGALTAASAAAGPAFEGMGITFGMRAERGAVSHFKIASRNTVMVETIGKSSAVGICGSGLTEIISELVGCGIITPDGAFCDKRLITSPIRARLCEYNGETAFRICAGVYLTQSDVRAVQLAKGAIRAAVETVAPDAERVIISGALGRHAGADALIGAGILPAYMRDKIEFAGNTSLEGAAELLENKYLRERIGSLTAKTILLSDSAEFERLFIKRMNFTD